MGHRTLSLALVLRALFLHADAYEELREDDNPFVEGLFLVVVISALTALLHLFGQVLQWASLPRVSDVRDAVLVVLQQQAWWPVLADDLRSLVSFQTIWDAAWQVFPVLFGAADPAASALNLVVWPLWAVASWLLYGLLAHAFARTLQGRGTLSQTLGTTALAFTPWLLRGLEVVPFLAVGGVVNTWQLILRYRALRVAHRLDWSTALAVTLLPFAVYVAAWLLVAAVVVVIVAVMAGR